MSMFSVRWTPEERLAVREAMFKHMNKNFMLPFIPGERNKGLRENWFQAQNSVLMADRLREFMDGVEIERLKEWLNDRYKQEAAKKAQHKKQIEDAKTATAACFDTKLDGPRPPANDQPSPCGEVQLQPQVQCVLGQPVLTEFELAVITALRVMAAPIQAKLKSFEDKLTSIESMVESLLDAATSPTPKPAASTFDKAIDAAMNGETGALSSIKILKPIRKRVAIFGVFAKQVNPQSLQKDYPGLDIEVHEKAYWPIKFDKVDYVMVCTKQANHADYRKLKSEVELAHGSLERFAHINGAMSEAKIKLSILQSEVTEETKKRADAHFKIGK